MRIVLVSVLALVGPIVLAATARAVVMEDFEEYSLGAELHGLNLGSGWLGVWNVPPEDRRSQVEIVGQSLDYSGGEILVDGGDRALEYVFIGGQNEVISTRRMPSQPGTVYLSFLYRDAVDNDPPGVGNDFIQFGFLDLPENPTASALNRDGEFQVRSGTAFGTSSGVAPLVDRTYLLVLKAEQTGATYDKLTLYVDPTFLEETANAPVTVEADSGLDLSGDAYFVIRRAFQDPGDKVLVDRFRIADTFVEAVGPEAASTLAWDGDGDGEWADVDGLLHSRWRDPADPATPTADVPDGTTDAILEATNTSTVNVGTIGSPAVREALRLSVDGGAVVIRDGWTLNVGSTATFAAGTTLEIGTGATLSVAGSLAVAPGGTMILGNDATLAAGSGNIDGMTTAGNTVVSVSSGNLTIGGIDESVPAILNKEGAGMLTLESSSGGDYPGQTAVNVAAGTFRIKGTDTLSGTPDVTLGNGTLCLVNDPVNVPGTGLIESWFAENTVGIDIFSLEVHLDPLLGTDESIDVFPGLLARLPADGTTALDRPLRYKTNDINTRSGGIAGTDLFAALWHGTMTVGEVGSGSLLEAGEMTFGVRSDEGSALWVDVSADPGVEDWQMIVDNRGLHSEQSQVGSVALASGTYQVAIPFYEKLGDESIEVRFDQGAFAGDQDQVWNQLTHVLNPGDPGQVGIWGGTDIEVSVLPAVDLAGDGAITVAGNSTLNVLTDYDAKLNVVRFVDGTLTTRGARKGISFALCTVESDGIMAGLDAQVATTLGDFDGKAHTGVTFVKTGSADLIVKGTGAGLAGTSFDVREGRLIAVASSNPVDGATLRLSGGELVLAGKEGESTADYTTNAVIVQSAGVLTAGSGGVGRTDPVVVTLGAAGTKDIDVGDGTLTLRTTDGYTLTVAANVMGSGAVEVTAGMVIMAATVDVGSLRVSGSGLLATIDPPNAEALEVHGGRLIVPGATVGEMNVTGGTVDSYGNLNVGQLELTGGTLALHDNDVVVSSMLTLATVSYSLSGVSSFEAGHVSGGSNLLTGAELTFHGGAVTVACDSYADGTSCASDIGDSASDGDENLLFAFDVYAPHHDLVIRSSTQITSLAAVLEFGDLYIESPPEGPPTILTLADADFSFDDVQLGDGAMIVCPGAMAIRGTLSFGNREPVDPSGPDGGDNSDYVPEPGTVALLLSGLVGLAAVAYRRRGSA